MATKQSKRKQASKDKVGKVEVVSFDLRRRLINVLGEEHYPYAEFLYHELAANSYDEDATEVQIIEDTIQPPGPGTPALYNITIRDNGNGMDMDKLKEYFMVGESGKPERRESERFKRPLIGRIGVGKVSILKVARQWTIETERHRGLSEPIRLHVHVDVDDWIEREAPGFAVQFIEPTGKPGTSIVLEEVHTKLREDRIIRHLQRLPLADKFMVWRNGEPIPPRRWYGINKFDINKKVEWEEGGKKRGGRVRGEIWIRPFTKNKREGAFISEPATESDALSREPAGIEVRVNKDMITREFFGHDTHGHQVNRIWGWVEADWLPILGNRTDYLRDSPAGHAFYETVKPLFLQAYNSVRYEKETRAQGRKGSKGAKSDNAETAGEADEFSRESGDVDESLEGLASRYGKALNEILSAKPEFAPVLPAPAKTSRGQPAKDRIYPVRPSGKTEPFEERDAGTDLAIVEKDENSKVKRPTSGAALRTQAKGSKRLAVGEIIINTKAGVRLRFVPLGPLDEPYRWDLDDAEDLSLAINTEHALYRSLDVRPGSVAHRLLCAWLVSLALAERSHPATGTSIAADLETISYELFNAWGPRR